MRKRTKKEFTPYNDYHDRPFGLKWGTAFAMDELTKTIEKGKAESSKVVEELPYMTRFEIDSVLQEAFMKSKTVSIQLNKRNRVGRLLDSKVGKFSGFADESNLYLGNYAIAWDSIRKVSVVE